MKKNNNSFLIIIFFIFFIIIILIINFSYNKKNNLEIEKFGYYDKRSNIGKYNPRDYDISDILGSKEIANEKEIKDLNLQLTPLDPNCIYKCDQKYNMNTRPKNFYNCNYQCSLNYKHSVLPSFMDTDAPLNDIPSRD